MSELKQFDHSHRQQIYEYVEQEGAVRPETARKDILVRPESGSKPTRSGPDLDPSVTLSVEDFEHHVSILKRDGYLEEQDGKLRVALEVDEHTETVELDGIEATIRPARQEDLTGIVGVIETVAADERYVVAARLADEIAREDVLLRRNEARDRVFFVATVSEDTVGWLHVEGVNAPKMDHTATLTVGVLEQYRGDGLGAKLMENGLEWARGEGYRKVYQNLPATNERAIAFLEDNGWSVESTRDGHYHIDGELVDEAQLAIWLDD